MEHVYLTKKEVDAAYEMKYITRKERDELINRINNNFKFDRKNKPNK